MRMLALFTYIYIIFVSLSRSFNAHVELGLCMVLIWWKPLFVGLCDCHAFNRQGRSIQLQYKLWQYYLHFALTSHPLFPSISCRFSLILIRHFFFFSIYFLSLLTVVFFCLKRNFYILCSFCSNRFSFFFFNPLALHFFSLSRSLYRSWPLKR